MRVYIPDEDMYLGAKDVGVERLKLQCDLVASPEGIQIDITQLELFIQVYQMRFRGKGTTARALKKLLSPEMVRPRTLWLQICIRNYYFRTSQMPSRCISAFTGPSKFLRATAQRRSASWRRSAASIYMSIKE